MPIPENSWDTWKPEDRDVWLHTHIARQPYLCQGTYSPLAFRDLARQEKEEKNEEAEDYRIKQYACKECDARIYISRFALTRMYDPSVIFARGHIRPIPTYTAHDNNYSLKRLITQLCQRGEKDSLVRPILKLLGATLQQLKDFADYTDELYVFAEGEYTQSSETLGKLLWDAYALREQEDFKEYKDESQLYFIRDWQRLRSPGGVPLFARVGPPPPEFSPSDFPYLLVFPSMYGRYDHQFMVIVEDNYYDKWAPRPDAAKRMRALTDLLKERFGQVREPERFTWGASSYSSYYWSISVDIFPRP